MDWISFIAFVLGIFLSHALAHKWLLKRARDKLIDELVALIENNEEVTMVISRKEKS